MGQMLKIVPFSKDCRETWNAFSARSEDAWFWHTRDWYEWLADLLGMAVVADAAFMAMQDEKILGIAPCMVFAGSDGKAATVGASYPTPWPAFAPMLSTQQRIDVERAIFAEYQNVASKYRAAGIELFSVVQANSFRRSAIPPANLPLRHGYQGTVFDTHVIDLSLPVESLWRDVRKGHKSAIRSGQKRFRIQRWLGEISDTDFGAYQELHAIAAGRVTRSQATFDAMRDWIRNGKALMVGAHDGGRWIGFVYIFLYRQGAYYASACNHPEAAAGLPVGHVLLWEAILRCREAGIELLEMGMQTYPSAGSGADDEKLVSISRFKRGFGGFAMPRYQAHLSLARGQNGNS